MNLIEQLGFEKCKQIVDGAPESNFPVKWCLVRKKYVRQVGFNTQHLVNGEWIDEFNVNPWIDLDSLRTAIAYHATLTNKGSTYKAQTIDTIYLCKIVDGLILNDSCVITVTFTGSTSEVLIGLSRQMVINRVGDVINLLFNNESYSLKKYQIEAALRPYLGSRTLIQAFG